jgi:serine/threonine protein kinase
MIDFLSHCLEKDATSRFSSAQLMRHPLMEKYPLYLPNPNSPHITENVPPEAMCVWDVIKDLVATLPNPNSDCEKKGENANASPIPVRYNSLFF